MSQTNRVRAGAIIIGNEVLSGKVIDRNTPLLIQSFRARGIRLERVVILPDEKDLIAATVRRLSEAFDLVVTSGGVGPTHDDVTMESVAQAFSEEMVTHDEIVSLLQRRVGGEVDESLLRVARVPRSAKLLWGDNPKWPVVHVQNVHMLPGVPSLFAICLDVLCQQFEEKPFRCHNVFVRLSENKIVKTLDAVVDAYPTVEVGSYPHYDQSDYKVRVTLEGDEEEQLNEALEMLLERVETEAVYKVTRA